MKEKKYHDNHIWPTYVSVPEKENYDKISIVIAVHGQVKYTLSCLVELSQYVPEAEVIVVDNASPDDTLEQIQDFDIQIIKLDKNESIAKAWNAGLAIATGDVLAVLNNDVNLTPNGIQDLAQAAWRTGISSIHGCMVSKELVFECNTDSPASSFPIGAALFFRRDVFESVGPFDEGMKIAFCEDSDWGFRARSLGYHWEFCPKALHHIDHVTVRTVKEVQNFYHYNHQRLKDRWLNQGIGERIKIYLDGSTSTNVYRNILMTLRSLKPQAWILIETNDKLLLELQKDKSVLDSVDRITTFDSKFLNYTVTPKTVIHNYTEILHEDDFIKKYQDLLEIN